MEENVLYERKNMKYKVLGEISPSNTLYDELVKFVIDNRMLVICCIEAHFTALYVISESAAVYYNPLKSNLGSLGLK